MWLKVAHFILKYRFWCLGVLAIYIAFLGFMTSKVRLEYEYNQTVPASDPAMVYFKKFKATFGEDANTLAIGFQSEKLKELNHFEYLKYYTDELERIPGVKSVTSITTLPEMIANRETQRFEFVPFFDTLPDTQAELDQKLARIQHNKSYQNRLYLPEQNAYLILVNIESSVLNSESRIDFIQRIVETGNQFSKIIGTEMHYAGIPFIRTTLTTQVKAELRLFLILSVLVTTLILFVVFRSWRNVLLPLFVIILVIVSTMGMLGFLGYKITLLTGLLPPIIVVIGIPNCVYFINKYHLEYAKHNNKIRALSYVLRKLGPITLITNLTTAIGFFVLTFVDIRILREFGMVAGLNVMATFVISLIVLPAFLMLMPPPSSKQLKHLDFKLVNDFIHWISHIVQQKPMYVYAVTGIVTMIALVGLFQVKALSYMVDDLPKNSNIRKDLAFFEKNFQGVMPLEVVINTGKPKGAYKLENLQIADSIENYLHHFSQLSQPLSVVNLLKSARQAFYNGDSTQYGLPTKQDRTYILRYLRNTASADSLNENLQQNLVRSFIDTAAQELRISMNMADIGSEQVEKIVYQTIKPHLDSLVNSIDTTLQVHVTGTTLLFLQGNTYLVGSLRYSLSMAIGIIAAIMALLFGKFRIIIISLIPNLIPLIVTAGLMGFFQIPLKPSTVLIFSIAFGIAVDDCIHFLARYRQETRQNKRNTQEAIAVCLRETGAGMFYTSVILFFGFIIFAFSDFGGTVSLGILTSTTLFFAMLTNLALLPTLLLQFDKYGDDFEVLMDISEEENEE